MRDVYSSHVGRIGYDAETKELHVQWQDTGKTSIYSGVPPAVADATMNAWSVGKALTADVKKFYPHRYLSEE
jgi:hypothetical protein